MSKHSSNDSDEERPTSQASDLTDLELGGGLSPDASVGTSNPLPYPPHEEGALSVGPSSTVNQGILNAQHESSRAASSAREQNTSSPLDIVLPAPIVTDCSTGQNQNLHKQYGACLNTPLHCSCRVASYTSG